MIPETIPDARRFSLTILATTNHLSISGPSPKIHRRSPNSRPSSGSPRVGPPAIPARAHGPRCILMAVSTITSTSASGDRRPTAATHKNSISTRPTRSLPMPKCRRLERSTSTAGAQTALTSDRPCRSTPTAKLASPVASRNSGSCGSTVAVIGSVFSSNRSVRISSNVTTTTPTVIFTRWCSART